MMNAWHLLWIIPAAAAMGFWSAALAGAAKDWREQK